MFIKMHKNDNVIIAVESIPKGTEVVEGIVVNEDIPQGHKIAIKDLDQGERIIRYGVTLGYALKPIKRGDWVNEDNLELPTPPSLDELEFGKKLVTRLPDPPVKTFKGYPNPTGGYAGTRNILGIVTTVQCVTGILNNAVKRIKQEILPKYPNVDDVVSINHAYGCGVAINAPEAKIPIRMLKNIVKHPNFGGETLVISLGCEKLTLDMLLDREHNTPENVVVLQNLKGHDAIIEEIIKAAEEKLKKLNKRKRVELPLSKLCIGLQCGGSDAFSGVTANPAAGYAADMLVNAGATVMFSEVTEVRDGVHFIAERCINDEVGKKLVDEMKWYDKYLESGCVDRSANPTPGNKKGGLSNIVEKAMGSIAKSGTSPIVEVLSPGEMPTKKGMIFAATPASDFVCGSCQLSSGMTLQVFMTGRGTPYGLALAPVIKVCSRDEMKNMWEDLIDINAGPIAKGEASIEEIGTQLFHEIIDVASGRKQTYAEKYEIYNDFVLFNPAPIT
ncbi:galactarate dehydratase [Weizmannia sp. CD-2023]|uniref:Galactarate dehydratase n=1 Tax=Heyndrickxia coagulans TaxID=1398 RepID=A0A133KZT5_HEYCO|nr:MULTISPECIES: galactarate dehydratase [Heyndrickxia]KGT37749.1 galactarate dehydrogenase [Heyndrickxia coagulans P38]KWZ85219.1 galactarate dehydratase [Heyndrickxia coagulans]MED4321495.1 galactarate dehydratase [Weizmannia sp. CD-2023]